MKPNIIIFILSSYDLFVRYLNKSIMSSSISTYPFAAYWPNYSTHKNSHTKLVYCQKQNT